MRLPIRPPAAQTSHAEACCDACTAGPVSARAELIVLEADPRPARSRVADRRITVAGLAISAGFMAAAISATGLPESVRHGLWLPVHLGLAGGAGTAIAGVLPFFVAALSAAPPAGGRLRGSAIILIAGGALLAGLGIVVGLPQVALTGSLSYLAGLGAVAVCAFWPLRSARGSRRRLVSLAYGAAIAQVALGVSIAGTMLAGYTPVVERWGFLKLAHAWLNVFGFLSVVVAATMVHLAPTVAGSRIVPRRSARVALTGLIAGPPLVALGLAIGVDAAARLGALAEGVGVIGLVVHAAVVQRDRGRWTTDPDWHRVTSWSLLAAPAWFFVSVLLAAGRIIWLGAVPTAWTLDGLVAPLAVGWVCQALIGAWSQLLPAIGPGDRAAHARQRRVLGRIATGRLVALNLGVTLVVLGEAAVWTPPSVIGGGLIAGSIVASLAIFFDAMRIGGAAILPISPGGQARAAD